MARRRSSLRGTVLGLAAWLLAGAPVYLGAGWLLAQVPELAANPNDTELELGGSYDQLTGSEGAEFDDWSSADLEAVHRFARHTKLTGGLRQTTRFGLTDTEVALGGYFPITDSLVANAEARSATPGDVLPERSISLAAQQALGRGWVVHGGYRQQSFTNADVDTFSLTGELYIAEFRVSYTANQSQLDTGDTALSHIFSGSAYYGDGSSLNAIGGVGQELEKVVFEAEDGTTTESVVRFDTVALSLWGRHWFTEHWGATYGVRYREQGDLYQSLGVFGGARSAF